MLREAEQSAREMPSMVWGEYARCATCDNVTAAYEQYGDGALMPICGACLVRMMDEYEQQRRERRK